MILVCLPIDFLLDLPIRSLVQRNQVVLVVLEVIIDFECCSKINLGGCANPGCTYCCKDCYTCYFQHS